MKTKFVTTRARYDSLGELVELLGFFYRGCVALCGGPSAQQKEIAAQQQQFYSTMQTDYSQMFAGQTAILNSLQQSFQPILAAGINQYGYSAAEQQALQSQATQGTGAAYHQASQALNENLAAKGGSSFIPSGENAQLQGQVASAAANQQSNQMLGITESGYAQGRQDYLSAASALGGVASTMNPTAYAQTANSSGSSAYSSAQANQQMSNQWMGLLGGALGSAAQIGLGVATGGASMMMPTFNGSGNGEGGGLSGSIGGSGSGASIIV